MSRLKILLTEEGINFADATFDTEDGIRGLGEQPFVSKIVFSQDLPHTYFTNTGKAMHCNVGNC